MKMSSSSSAQLSPPTDSHPRESDACKYGSQVTTSPSNHTSIASLTGLDRDSEVAILSPASPQADCNPSGCLVPDKSSRESRSISPWERSVQSARSGKHRTGSTEHRSAPEVTTKTSVQIEQVQPTNMLGLVNARLNTLGSVHVAPSRFGTDSLNILFPRLHRACAVRTKRKHKILEVSDANSDRNETELGNLNGTEAHPNRRFSCIQLLDQPFLRL